MLHSQQWKNQRWSSNIYREISIMDMEKSIKFTKKDSITGAFLELYQLKIAINMLQTNLSQTSRSG